MVHQRKLINMTHLKTPFLQILLLSLMGMLLLSSPVKAETVILDKIAAIADEDVVMESELQQRIALIKNNLRASNKELPPPAILRTEVLNQLITEKLLFQIAEKSGIRISDAELNNTMNRIAGQNNMSLAQFQQAMERQGQSYAAAREQLRKDMIIREVQQSNVQRRINVTPSEIEHFLQSEEGIALTEPSYQTEHLLLALSKDASNKERAKAKALMTKQKTLFTKNSAKHLIKNHQTITGGSLGWRKKQDLPSVFSQVVPQLTNGEVSDIIESPSGLHLVKLLDTRGSSQTVTQTKARHILLKPTAIRSEAESLELIKQLRQRILAGEDFATLAKEYSDDIGNAREGGDLGWANPGSFVPPFEKAMNNTSKGDISSPIKTQFGWHIVQVLDRREQDVTEQIRQNMAYEHLFKQRYEERLAIWLQRIRDEAYIEIK